MTDPNYSPAFLAGALRSYVIVAIAFLLIGAGGALGFAWHFWRAKSVVETPLASVRQKDSSLVVARVPDAKAKPAQIIPKGATVERVVHLEVQPRATVAEVTRPKPDTLPIVQAQSVPVTINETVAVLSAPVLCRPVGIDLTLIRLTDGTQRVLASSKDGIVLDSLSVDHPVTNVTVPKVLAWVAGPLYASHAAYGAFVGHEQGPTLVMAGGTRQARGGSAFVGVGIRF